MEQIERQQHTPKNVILATIDHDDASKYFSRDSDGQYFFHDTATKRSEKVDEGTMFAAVVKHGYVFV